MKNVLVVGSGGREHAICWALSKSGENPKIYCAPGNAGISQIAECVGISAMDVEELARFAEAREINLTVVGGESSLAVGIVDEFERRNLKIVGASRAAARLESSKIFAKDFMTRHKIPTAKYKIANSVNEALQILRSGEFGDENSSTVVKADGLAAGKGVIVAQNRAQAEAAVEDMMLGGSIGKEAASRVVLEETLIGREVSLLLFADGKNFALMPPARDHKRIGDGDTGANTGGMGTITDKKLLDEKQLQKIVRKIIEPTLKGAAEEGFPFRGILFLGLMMTDEGVKVLEYNARFGDPETQAILIRLKSNFLEICEAIAEQRLDEIKVEFDEKASACVIIASRGYPAKPETGDVIKGLEQASERKNVVVFHSGTARNEKGDFITAGGRVLGVTATGKTLEKALQRSYAAVAEISWDGAQFRRDIGK